MGLDVTDKYSAAGRGAAYRAAGGISAAAEEALWAGARVVDGAAVDFPSYDGGRGAQPSEDWVMYVGAVFSLPGMQSDADGFIQNAAAHIDNIELLNTARGRAFAALWAAAQMGWVMLRDDLDLHVEMRKRKGHRAYRVLVRRGASGEEFWLCGALDIVFLFDGLGVFVRPVLASGVLYVPAWPLPRDVAQFADAYTAAVMWGAVLRRADGMHLLLKTLRLGESPLGRAMQRLDQTDACRFGDGAAELTWDELRVGGDMFALDGRFGSILIACWVLLAGHGAVAAAFGRIDDPSFMAWALYRRDALLPALRHLPGPFAMDARPPEPTYVVDAWGRALIRYGSVAAERPGAIYRARTCAAPPPITAPWTQDLLTREGMWVEVRAGGIGDVGASRELVMAIGQRDPSGPTLVTSEAPPQSPLYRWMPPPLYEALCAASPALARLRAARAQELGAGWTALHFGELHLDRFYLARLDAATGLVDVRLAEDLGALLALLDAGDPPGTGFGRRVPVGQVYSDDPWLLLRHLSGRGCRDFAQLLNMPGMPPALRELAARLPAQWRARQMRPLAGRAIELRVNGAVVPGAGPIAVEGGRRVVRFAPMAAAAARVELAVGSDGAVQLHAGRPVLAGPLDAVPWWWDGAAGELEWRGGPTEAQSEFITSGADLEVRGPTVTPDGRFCVAGGPRGLVYFDDCAIIARLLRDGTAECGHQWVEGRRVRAVFATTASVGDKA